jgi:hypothetical protein
MGTLATITLEYKGNQYIIKDRWPHSWATCDAMRFQWEENNYACDCNRSRFIQRQCDGTFPEMDCGETIKLVEMTTLYTTDDEPKGAE